MRERFPQLDGWRGISILLVLAAHLLPLGPKRFQLNATAGVAGMAIFFTLSGFLITSFLLKSPSVANFISRRFFRIVPLAMLYILVALAVAKAPFDAYVPHMLFYGNLPPFPLIATTAHLWSVCVEMQFYLGIAVAFAALGTKGLFLCPLLAVAVTALRVVDGMPVSIVTWYRVDEILAGSSLALIFFGRFGAGARSLLQRTPLVVVMLLFLVSCHPLGDPVSYLRPYFAAAMVGTTLFAAHRHLGSKHLAYIAEISFALYVIHPILVVSWLGSGDTLERYAKRPLLFLALLALAHLSTFYYERRWIEIGRKLGRATSVPHTGG